ncbi:MAG TPA: beta-ketoacyl synthase N-terminal-like domain-containing protein [Fibrobacteria bacterium]|nr:beta-ketoacyl synthase N-terminal-like domain-containing protein [Fibrobacteria bacterium]
MIAQAPIETGITGMGILSSIGRDVPTFCASLREGRAGFSRAERKHPSAPVDIAAEIKDFSFLEELKRCNDLSEPTFRAARRLGQRAPFPVQVAILSALEAWSMAGMFVSRPAPERIGVIVAGQNTTQNYQFGLIPGFLANPEYLTPRYGLEFFDSNHVGILSELLGIHGEGFVVGGASATGNLALIKAWQAVSSGWLDACLVAGITADPSPMDLQGFFSMGAMGGRKFSGNPEKACRPFDVQHEGFIYGQAGACVVLESRASAQNRGAPLLATVNSGAVYLDGNSSSNPSMEGEAAAMRLAIAGSGLPLSEIGYVNTHGSSSPLGDRTEAEAIREVFGDLASEVWMNSTKGLTGHCLQSAGVVEVIATVLQMREGFIHPNRNLEEPVQTGLRFSGPVAVETRIEAALSNSFGFGGINSSVVLTRGH